MKNHEQQQLHNKHITKSKTEANTQTDHATPSIAIGRIHAVRACVRVCVVPVSSVQLQTEWLDGSRAEMYADRRPVAFNESDVRRLRCIVNGSYPAPQVAVYVGRDDVTEWFVADVELVRDGVPPYLRELYYRLQLTDDRFRIRHSVSPRFKRNDLFVACTADFAPMRDVLKTANHMTELQEIFVS